MKRKILIGIMVLIIVLYSPVYAVDKNTDYTHLPTSFDLRNKINIRVENQEQSGWCSAYAMTKTLETYILLTRGIDYNFSEAYLSYSEAPYFGGDVQWKTDITTARALVDNPFSGQYVLESEIATKDYEFNETNKKKFENAKSIIKEYDVEFFDKKEIRNESIKNHIMTKGGVYLSIDSDKKYYNPTTNAIFCNEEKDYSNIELNTREQALKYVNETSAHAVTIIGWDDNYSKDNFNAKPENDGAWLVLNSWGNNWGNKGTAWVSYENIKYVYDTPFGIKSIKFKGELNAEFKYEYNKISNTITGKITADEKIESIEGWEQYSEDIYNKKFTDPFEPYSIELKSKIDDTATTKVEINIPKEVFEEQIENEKTQVEMQTEREKEIEELKKEKEKRDSLLNILDIMIYGGIGIIIVAIIVFICISKKKK